MRLDQKLGLLANARFRLVMDRRRSEGRAYVDPGRCRCVVSALCNRSDQDGRCHPSLELIAAESDVSMRTVQAVLAALVDEGLVRVHSRNRERGAAKVRGGATNVYQLDWQALCECAYGGPRAPDPDELEPRSEEGHPGVGTGAATAHESNETGAGAARAPEGTGAAAAREQAQPLQGTGAVAAQNRRSGEHHSKEEPLREPSKEPPPSPPAGEPEGGGGDALFDHPSAPEADSPTDDDWAGRILAAYPPTSSDLLLADTQAAVDAIRRERGRPGGYTPTEIVAAAEACAGLVRSGRLREPLWCRSWLRSEGYATHARATRELAAARAAAEDEPPPVRVEVDPRQVAEHRRRIDEALAPLGDAELRALADRVIAAQPSEFARARLRSCDPRNSRGLRTLMATELEVAHA